MKMKLKCNKDKKSEGITLIVLIITLIVLLILAGVLIAMLTGENGILGQANKSKENTEKAEVIERAQLDVVNWKLDELRAGKDGKVTNVELKKILTGKEYVKELQEESFISVKGKHEILYSEIYKELQSGGTKVEGVEIPHGFYHVEGTTKEEGIVISDIRGDDINNTKQGNQFVWIPVEEFNEFKLKQGYYNGTLQNFPFATTGIENGKYYEPIGDGIANNTEVEKMYKSVKENKGFYIARYETGKEETNIAVSKKNANVWNNVKWGNSMLDEMGGAVQYARNFATQHNYTGVTSTLCYGVQWDATLKFIDPTWNGYTKDSTGKGNHSGNIINTGSNDNYKTKNIYDLAGNVWEWTMESYSTTNRVNRGGYYNSSGYYYPVSRRSYYNPNDIETIIGFRVTLFL